MGTVKPNAYHVAKTLGADVRRRLLNAYRGRQAGDGGEAWWLRKPGGGRDVLLLEHKGMAKDGALTDWGVLVAESLVNPPLIRPPLESWGQVLVTAKTGNLEATSKALLEFIQAQDSTGALAYYVIMALVEAEWNVDLKATVGIPTLRSPDMKDIHDRWLVLCPSCDAGMSMSCQCPKGDYRNVILNLVTEVERLRAGGRIDG